MSTMKLSMVSLMHGEHDVNAVMLFIMNFRSYIILWWQSYLVVHQQVNDKV